MSRCSRKSSNSERSGASTASTTSIPPKVCRHEMNADVLTLMTDTNPCRRFYRCPNQKVSDCNFFEWVDPELPSFQKECVQKLKAQRDSLDEQLKCKTMLEGLLSGRLRMKNSEIEALKKCNHEAEQSIDELATNNTELEHILEQLKVQLLDLRKKKIMMQLLIVILVFIVVCGSKWIE